MSFSVDELHCVFQLIASSTASSIFSADEKDDVEGRCQASIDAAIAYIDGTISDQVVGTCAQEQQQHDDMLM